MKMVTSQGSVRVSVDVPAPLDLRSERCIVSYALMLSRHRHKAVTIERCRFLYDPFVFYMTPFDFKKLVFFLFFFPDRWVLDTIAWVLA